MALIMKIVNELIALNDELIMGIELHGGDTTDSQLDYMEMLIDKAIKNKDRRMLTLLRIVFEYMMDELAVKNWGEE